VKILEFDRYKVVTDKISELRKQRQNPPTKEQETLIKDKSLIESILRKLKADDPSEAEVVAIGKWLEKISMFVCINNKLELTELVSVMVLLGQERAKLNELYDYPGIDLMKRVREGMIRYMVVLSEIRVHQKEFLEHWFTDEYWFGEWSKILLELSLESKMTKYGFANVRAKDFLYLLMCELATADDASKLDHPMICLQPQEDQNFHLLVPTKVAVNEYKIQIDRILNGMETFTNWTNQTLASLQLP
jgi:hypothetical protein